LTLCTAGFVVREERGVPLPWCVNNIDIQMNSDVALGVELAWIRRPGVDRVTTKQQHIASL
jgi:hypothetical protein